MSRHENGMEPSGRNALAYAKALGVDVNELYVDGDDDAEAAPVAPAPDLAEALAATVRAIVVAEVAKLHGKVAA